MRLMELMGLMELMELMGQIPRLDTVPERIFSVNGKILLNKML